MKRLHLEPDEKAILEGDHAAQSNGKERDRLKAILLRSEGWTVPQISQALRLHQTTIIRHINEYRAGKVKNENGGGSKGYLTEEQTQELIVHLETNLYHHNHEIVMVVKERYGVVFSVPGMHKWLHRNGFSYKKPKGCPHKADPELQKQFVAKYEELKKEVGSEPILFMDSVHPTQATKLAYGWIRTGTTKHIGTTASRTRLNVVGAIQLGHIAEAITCQYETINAESIIDFMGKIRAQYDSKTIHLILDQSGYHKSKLLPNEAFKLGIKLHFLPPYSPNLNPIERLWKVMNEKVRNNHFFKGAKDFKEAINGFFDDILPSIGNELNDRINDNFQMLKT